MTIEQMIARQQELLNAARSAGRNMTREEAAEFDSLQRSIDAARAAGAGIAHGGQSSTPAAPANNTPEGQRQQTPAAGEGGNGGQDPQNAQRAIEAERQRIRSIEDLCTEFGLEARSYIDNGSTEEQVRAAVLEHLRSQHSPVATGIQVTDTQEDKFRRAAADSLLMRSGMTLERPEDGARSLMGMSIRDLAIECLQRDGSSESNLNRRSSDELYTMMARGFYNPEASFPAILDQTIEKAYKEGYRKVAVTFDKFTKKGSLKDFKKHDNYYVAGPVGEFYEVPENGELKHDIFKDDKLPQRQLKTYGRQFTLSRKAFIDDDIGLVTSLPARYAAAARKTINKQVYQILINNSNIYDGAALFGKEHKNLLASDNEDVPNQSPSNHLLGVGGQCLEDGTEVYLDQDQANTVNGYGVTTAINQNGYRLWGNYTGAYPASSDAKDIWFAVRRMFSWQGNNFIQTYFDEVDDPMNNVLVQSVVDSENIRCSAYAPKYWAGASIEYKSDDNPKTAILAGTMKFRQHIAPYTPAQEIVDIIDYDTDTLAAAVGGN